MLEMVSQRPAGFFRTGALRRYVKAGVEWTLVNAGVPHLLDLTNRGSTLILAYHNVVPDTMHYGDAALHISLKRFRAQLDAVERTHDIVSLEAVFHQPAVRPRAVITFDDAYRGAVTLAVPELARRNLPATIFISPAFIPDGEFWWDGLRDIDGGPLPRERRDWLINEVGGSNVAVRARALAHGCRAEGVPTIARAASEAELRVAQDQHARLRYGAHSWSHPNLVTLAGEQLLEELVRPLVWLQSRFTNVLPWMAYPYGLSSDAVAAAAAHAGYTGALCVDGGHFKGTPPDRFRIPRLNIPAGLSENGFRLRLAGLFHA